MPLIIIIGLTGLYLNHSRFVLGFLPSGSYDEAKFDEWPDPEPVDEAEALAIAIAVFPADTFKKNAKIEYHKRAVQMFDGPSGRVIVDNNTGHYWVKTRLRRKTYDPAGRQVDSKFYWGTLFKSLHTRGWVTRGLGTWLADITAGAMVVFGLTGMVLFLTPRLRRRRNKRTQVEVARSNVPRPKRIKLKN